MFGVRPIRAGLCAILLIAASSVAVAGCSPPEQLGLVICFPSAGSTVLYPAAIEMAANTGGVPITGVLVYDGNNLVDTLTSLPGELIDEGRFNGFHRITVNAWDANGKLYQATTSFTIIGNGFGPCTQGNMPVTLCLPPQDGFLASGSLLVSAYFGPGIASWSTTLDGQPFASSSQPGLQVTEGLLEFITGTLVSAGEHTFVLNSVESSGATLSVTRNFTVYYFLNCPPKGTTCSPGIEVQQPIALGPGSAVQESPSFPLQAQVVNNTVPITAMIAYLDGVKVAQSAGPGISANVAAAKGSHFIVILAWDTAGNLYQTYGNVNIQ